MTPALSRTLAPRRVLPAVIVLLVVTALLPLRFTRWLGWFNGPTETILAPISGPMHALVSWLNPAVPRGKDGPVVEELKRQVETLTQQHLRDEQEILRLAREMEEAFKLIQLNPGMAVRQLSAPVIGTSSDLSSRLLTVRAGQKQGVEKDTVVVAPGLQLLGRVVEVSPRTCDVQPITSKAAASIIVRLMIDGTAARPLLARLDPVGDGTLVGPVQSEGDGGTEIKPGTLVRLDDRDRWPAHAQMLIVGIVEKTASSPENPLRRVVTVRPTLPLARVSDVVIRVAEEADETLTVPGKEKPR